MSWRPQLSGDKALTAQAIARDLASRVRNWSIISAGSTDQQPRGALPENARDGSLARGYVGFTLACTQFEFCFPSEEWDKVAHDYLKASVDSAERITEYPLGLFSGWAGIGFAASLASRGNSRYRNLLSSIDSLLKPRTLSLIQNLQARNTGCRVADFDLISGLTGIGLYCLTRSRATDVSDLLQALVRSLVRLSLTEEGLPQWHTPPDYLFPSFRDSYPHGNLNCGLAHGIPGVLAFLALAKSAEVECEKLDDALRYLAKWISEQQMSDLWGVNWPGVIPVGRCNQPAGDATGRSTHKVDPCRSAWCYGSPGIASALWLAGEALNCEQFRDAAITAMKAVYRRPVSVRGIPSPGFCHGIAGLLQITLRFANATRLAVFTEAAELLADQLIALYNPDHLLGYRVPDPSSKPCDMPGLLEGMTSIPLVLLAASTEIEPIWDRCFLLSPVI